MSMTGVLDLATALSVTAYKGKRIAATWAWIVSRICMRPPCGYSTSSFYSLRRDVQEMEKPEARSRRIRPKPSMILGLFPGTEPPRHEDADAIPRICDPTGNR